MTRRIGLVRKKFLTRDKLIEIIDELTSQSRQNKWSPFIRKQWLEFVDKIEDNFERIFVELRNMTWKPKPFIIFPRKEKGKERVMYASLPEELIVDTLFTECLKYVFFVCKKIIPENSYGSIKGKGQHDLRKTIIDKVHNRTDVFVGCYDTKKYYPTIDHGVAMDIVRKHIKDHWLLWLCEVIIKRMGEIGTALGAPSSNPLGHIYHSVIDWIMILKLRVRRYYRFCDDKWTIHRDKNYLHHISRALVRETQNVLHQKIKPNWRVVYCKEERFECLGAMINSHGARLCSASRRVIERHIRSRIKSNDPMKALKTWSGVRGGMKNLNVSNLIRYWHEVYPQFFNLILWGKRILWLERHRKRWHKRLQHILTIARDCRSEMNKKLYPLGVRTRTLKLNLSAMTITPNMRLEKRIII
ncbi:MAG: hypothetical protein J6O49_05825 [Bacteroidaceae bacterium]|nr:hypothetical protein [Bacteroidaceae bacterium]